ncbi:MAG TPA: metal-dependent hydrolase [Holophagaceae bacterium]|jgi:inner membrane protein|nr:metal-dependent hydrolase [Holophagaceae bacterium]
MASPLTHAMTGLAIGTVFWRRGDRARFWIAGAACAALPDLDAFGVIFGIPYNASPFGHRGITHSLFFAALLAVLVAWRAFDADTRRRMGFYLFLATASHGLLDSMTSDGLGVGFFMPFYDARYFLPWRPITITPLHVPHIPGAREFMVRSSELLRIWIPLGIFTTAVAFIRRGLLRGREKPA